MPYTTPTHVAQKQQPWTGLNTRQTLSSGRHEIFHYDPVAPLDSLDFLLKAQYNQHEALFNDKNETVLQAETLGMDHGRVLKNRTVLVVKPPLPMEHPIRIMQQTKRESVHSISNAIVGPHITGTNGGYSRKEDGGIYSA